MNIKDIQKSKVAERNKAIIDWANKRPKQIKDYNSTSTFKDNLKYYCHINNIELIEEFQFHPQRKWRFDFYIPYLKIGIEYNGIMSAKSRHTTITGYTKDMEKINAAQILGYKVLQYTPLNFKDVVKDLTEILLNEIK